MPNSLRRLTPEERPEEYEVSRNPNHPENDNGVVAAGGARPRDENALSFRHFLQPHSDVVPQPPPSRSRGTRGGVDLVDVTMALPDFVQDHLVMESLASGGDQLNDLSPSRQHPLDLHVLNEILPDFASSQRNPHRISQSNNRRSCPAEQLPTTDAESPISHSSALPDFLSDGPMQLNNDSNIVNSPSPSSSSNRASRCRPPLENSLPDEPVRGPSFESKESLRLEIERLRMELADKNRRLGQLETELSRQRTTSGALESSLRLAENKLADATRRAADAEDHLATNLSVASNMENGHGDVAQNGIESYIDVGRVLHIASSSENLISQLSSQIEELKRLTINVATHSRGEKRKEKDSTSRSQH